MKPNSGKGYFYSMGQRDKLKYKLTYSLESMRRPYRQVPALLKRNEWPEWAIFAYVSGYYRG